MALEANRPAVEYYVHLFLLDAAVPHAPLETIMVNAEY